MEVLRLITRQRESAIRLIERIYWPRTIGLGFSFIAVSSFLYRDNASIALWVLLVFWGLLWPQIAFVSAKKAKDPFKSEFRNLFIDAFMIGFWVPVMSFSLVPSIAILSMHLLSIMSVLGLRKAAWGLVAESAGIVAAILILGFRVELHTNIYLIAASLPMMTLYPLFVGYNAYSLSLKLAAKQAVLRRLSRTDGLTGLNNRMYWEEQLEHSFKLHQRESLKASIVFLDADHFKQINDSYGHVIGDEVLKKIAKLMLECARETDICGRYGGEEFCILMPNTDKANAQILSERLRIKVAEAQLCSKPLIKGSISLGVSEISDSMLSYGEWLAAADKSLYIAKNKGRNQTFVADS